MLSYITTADAIFSTIFFYMAWISASTGKFSLSLVYLARTWELIIVE